MAPGAQSRAGDGGRGAAAGAAQPERRGMPRVAAAACSSVLGPGAAAARHPVQLSSCVAALAAATDAAAPLLQT